MRYTKLNPRLISQISDCLLRGLTIKQTLVECDVTPQTFINWIKKGKLKNDDVYHQLFDSLVRVEQQVNKTMRINHNEIIEKRVSALRKKHPFKPIRIVS